MVTIKNVKASARALAYETSEGTLVAAMCKHGLEIGESHITFPEAMLDSLTWVVGWKHEVIAGEDRRYLEASEINEMKALKRLLDRLVKMGGEENLDPKYEEEADEPEVTDLKPVVNTKWQGNFDHVKPGQRYASKHGGECVVLSIGDWAARVRWSAGAEGSVRYWQFEEEMTLIEGDK